MASRGLAALLFGAALQAQPAFDVASVKAVDIATLGRPYSMSFGATHNEVVFANARLTEIVRWAYGLASDTQVSGPDWIRSKQYLYSILAKASPGTPSDQLPLMLQTLLADRFKLAIHHEQKVMPHFQLVTAKNGPKMKAAAEFPDGYRQTVTSGHIDAVLDMKTLLTLLARFDPPGAPTVFPERNSRTPRGEVQDDPLIDATHLTGMFFVKLQWAPKAVGSRKAGIMPAGSIDPTGPSLFTALEEQLGLKLEYTKGPVDILVIDRAEKIPVEN